MMRAKLTDLLVDPLTHQPLKLQILKQEGDNVIEGNLVGESAKYPITNGIPRFVLTKDRDQRQTSDSFAFKWKLVNTYSSTARNETFRSWLIKRYGFRNVEEMRSYFSNRRMILDAGCGSGFSSSQWLTPSNPSQWIGVDISEAIDVAQEKLGALPNTHFIQADISQMPFRKCSFDTIFAEGSLHHTPSTEGALKALAPLLGLGGEFLFYVYRKKAPIREFTDDYVRSVFSSMPPELAWEKMRPLTRLGESLAGLKDEFEVREDVPELGIKAGRYPIQRFIYLYFAKLFWNDAISFEENHHVNFDWYHPRYAHRQTEEQVRSWCTESQLRIAHFDADESGLTVRAIKYD
jgi:ubiquinone/menaquinone biosynthesis C-methylase UbiE